MGKCSLKISAFILTIAIVLSISPSLRSFASTIDSGICGDNLRWTLDDKGTLTISGSGKMLNWDNFDDVPWIDYTDDIYSVKLSGGITSIGECAFAYLYNIKSIDLPSTVISIESGSFYECFNLESIKLPDGLVGIGSAAFSGCSSISEILIPDGVKYINAYTFYECTHLKSIVLPSGIIKINPSAFDKCNFLHDIYYRGTFDQFEKVAGHDCFGEYDVIHYFGDNPIMINKQPADFSGPTGSTARFNVGVDGDLLTYQWQTYSSSKWVNSSLPGANTATLSVPVISSRDGYKFRCVVTDAYKVSVTTRTATLSISDPLSITMHPKDFSGMVGSTAIFKVATKGAVAKYQWQTCKNGVWADSSLPGARTAALSVPVTQARNGYRFRCVITDTGNNTIKTNPALLTVTTAAPLSITTQPKDYSGVSGSTATFKITAQGTGLKYQWQTYSNGTWKNSSLPGYNTAALSVPVILSRNGYKFRCVVKDSSNHSAISNIATLHVVSSSLSITTQPKDYTGSVGSTAIFGVVANGTDLKYQWQTYSGGTWKNSSLPGYNTSTLSVPVILSRNGYKFRCVVTDSKGHSITSNIVVLNVV